MVPAHGAVWSPAPVGGGVVVGTSAATGGATFNVSATVRVPQLEVVYTPTVSEVLKDGWLKYLAMAVVVWCVVFVHFLFVYLFVCLFVLRHTLLPWE